MDTALDDPAEQLRSVMRYQFGRLRNGSKLLAQAAKVSPRTAESWLYGISSPSFGSLVELLASCEEIAAAVDQIIKEKKMLGFSVNIAFGWNGFGVCWSEVRLGLLTVTVARGSIPGRLAALQAAYAEVTRYLGGPL